MPHVPLLERQSHGSYLYPTTEGYRWASTFHARLFPGGTPYPIMH